MNLSYDIQIYIIILFLKTNFIKMNISNVVEFNTYLNINLNNLSLKDYFIKIHDKFYKNVDISFMEYFLELCKHKDEFIVEHEKLKEYGLII